MHVILYKRHKASCPHKANKHHHRCFCPVWMEYNVNVVQTRKSTKTVNWDTSQDKARAIEKTYLDAELGRGPAPPEAKTVEQAIALFMDSKRGEDLSPNTLYKHTLTLKRLQNFCERAGVFFVQNITLSHLTSWRAAWPFESPLAKRNNQERVKSFFKFCSDAGIDGTSHMFRHTFSVELLKAGVDIREVSRALGHSSVVITERYYVKWNKAQQDILDGDLARA